MWAYGGSQAQDHGGGCQCVVRGERRIAGVCVAERSAIQQQEGKIHPRVGHTGEAPITL